MSNSTSSISQLSLSQVPSVTHQSSIKVRSPQRTSESRRRRTTNFIFISFTTLVMLSQVMVMAEAMWLFQDLSLGSFGSQNLTNQQIVQQLTQQIQQSQQTQQQQQVTPITEPSVATKSQAADNSYASYGSNLLSIAGIQPSSIASVLNMVGDTGFRYFNIQDQCRNRAACDLGYMLYKRLSFVHNWLIRTSVRTLTDMNNAYSQSWMEGMLGRNCSAVYVSCRQSPLEGLMNLALLQHLAAR